MSHSFDASAAGQQTQKRKLRVGISDVNLKSEQLVGPSGSGRTAYCGNLSLVPANYQWPQPSSTISLLRAGVHKTPDQRDSTVQSSATTPRLQVVMGSEDPTTAQPLDLDRESDDDFEEVHSLMEETLIPKRYGRYHSTETDPTLNAGTSGHKRHIIEIDHSASLRNKARELTNDLATAKLTAAHWMSRMNSQFNDAKRKYEAQVAAQKEVLDKYTSQFSQFHAFLADQRQHQAAMKAEYDATLTDLRTRDAEALRQQVDAIKADYEHLRTSAEARHETALANLRSGDGEALQQQVEVYETTLTELWSKDGEALRQQTDAIKAEYNEQVEQEIRRLEAQKESELAALEQRIDARVLRVLRSTQNHDRYQSPTRQDEPARQSTPVTTSLLNDRMPGDDGVAGIQPQGHLSLDQRGSQHIKRFPPLSVYRADGEASTSRRYTPGPSSAPGLRMSSRYTPRRSHGKGRVYSSRTSLVGYEQIPALHVHPGTPSGSRRPHFNNQTPNPIDDNTDDVSEDSEREDLPTKSRHGQAAAPNTPRTQRALSDVPAKTHSAYLGLIRKVYDDGSATNDGEGVAVLQTTAPPGLVQSYDTGGPGPSLANFQFDMRNNEKSRWNQRALFLLLQYTIDLKTEDRWKHLPSLGQIEAAFLQDLMIKKYKRLRQKWRDSRQKLKDNGTVETIEESEARMVDRLDAHSKRSRRDKRRSSKYARRVEIVGAMIDIKDADQAEDTDVWVWLAGVLKHLGKNGMSSEESSDGGEDLETVYCVKTLDWRRRMDRELDLIDHVRFTDRDIFNPQGSMPRRRHRSSDNRSSDRRPVTGLPESFYDQEWLGKQSEEYRRLELCESEETFPWLSVYARRG